ncbi:MULTISPECIES: glycosyltransferase family 2 protein [Thiorhodovibrio]|uniref:glycosyltransferase family 2 protein n=1 Tax=Thiorhodovibrio TaxID=61593 RepID=UPI001A938405|nr:MULTISPECIES: glycosyltransferase family 2 protein [Thiorhodovibrio]MBK5969023.1 glycosyltransferase [Thiorhodovibrio winogradskyi]WPL15096.1 Bactoprenol glucosyl transferase [Thiorhodovibrio litoralis]
MLSIICPLYNEQAAVEPFFARLLPSLAAAGEPFEILCIDDGSQDDTLGALRRAQQDCAAIRIVELSRNFGKESALTAGLDLARGDAVIPIDVDLQDPPELIPELVAKWRQGYEVVLARRSDRTSDSWLKRQSAEVFYRLHNRIGEVPLPDNVGDFRLLDRAVVAAVRQLPERRRFMKGLFAWVGFRTTTVAYTRAPRSAGHSKFNGWRLWNFALEGITSHSTVPLRIWTYGGALVAGLAFCYGLFITLRTLVVGVDMPGYASLMTAVLFLGGVQLIGIGVLGEYLGRLYLESKQRPLYLIRAIHDTDSREP